MIETEKIPIRIVSSANIQEHWSKKYKREKAQKELIYFYISKVLNEITLPVKITLIRIGPRKLDDDNLVYSLKSHRDFICSLIRPGLAPGRADGDNTIVITYCQEKGATKEYALKIRFEKNE